MKYDEKCFLKPFDLWYRDYKKEKKPKFSLFSIHGEGALFPPNTLNITNDFILNFKKIIIEAHDFIIKYLELQENLKTVYVNNANNFSPLNSNLYKKYSTILSISPNEHQIAEDYRKIFNLSVYNNIITEKIVISEESKEYFFNNINNNIINNDTILISMTSYPARISGIFEVFISLLNQSVNLSSYQCFLTLAKEKFIHGEKDLQENVQKLIKNGWVKLIWYHNILIS